jgi:hypothetical protein
MPKKCIVCEKVAEFGIKGSSEFYCKGCATEQFQDLDYLQKIEHIEAAREIVRAVDKEMGTTEKDEEE